MPTVLPTRSALLAASLADLAGWHLVVFCPCRSHPRSVSLAEIAIERGQRTTLARVLARLRCERCGAAPATVHACLGDPFAPQAWRVALAPVDRKR